MTNRSLHKPALFRDLGYTPHDGQIQVHKSTAERRVVACGVRWGKTLCAAAEAMAGVLAPCDHSVGWVVAPTYDLAQKVHREVVRFAVEKLRHRVVQIRESERRVLMRNLGGGVSEIRAKSADNPTSLLGEGLSWLVVDEASRLHPRIWQGYLSQRLIDKRGWALLISTPSGKGWFHEAYRRGQGSDENWASWNYPSWNNPYLDRERIDAERALLPQRVFDQEYGGQFLEGAGQVFRGVRECATGEFADPDENQTYVAGLDLAKVADFSVLTILDGDGQVVFVDRFHRIDWSVQVDRVRTACERYGNCRVLVDSTGAGEPVFEILRKADVRVEGYKFTAGSKAALIDNLALMLEQRSLVLPRAEVCPELIDEMEAFEFTVTDGGTVRTGAPGGQHDDCVVSLALAAWMRNTRGPAVYTGPLLPSHEELAMIRAQRNRRWTGGEEPLTDSMHRGLMREF
ncbi:MAG: hypothetical protein DRQ55_09690 [Planctomycetota bacterium]|nr:MAG: hypothetical protein DRQ55_09690 [Planctomycetota bacterium]